MSGLRMVAQCVATFDRASAGSFSQPHYETRDYIAHSVLVLLRCGQHPQHARQAAIAVDKNKYR
jgi:hypothetical protein